MILGRSAASSVRTALYKYPNVFGTPEMRVRVLPSRTRSGGPVVFGVQPSQQEPAGDEIETPDDALPCFNLTPTIFTLCAKLPAVCHEN
jgi:hypothetical protein